jgi:predicted negative regulator of RcsB-dependent stress response
MAGVTAALLKNDAVALDAAVEEMNSAVRRAPNSTPVRLTRGFTIIHLPVAKRDSSAVAEDLNFIMETAPGGRPEDVVHVLLGDVYAETGQLDAARREYEQVSGASSFAAEQARARLIELKKGAVSPAAIGMVRAGTGNRCVMCHAPGADN